MEVCVVCVCGCVRFTLEFLSALYRTLMALWQGCLYSLTNLGKGPQRGEKEKRDQRRLKVVRDESCGWGCLDYSVDAPSTPPEGGSPARIGQTVENNHLRGDSSQ